MVEAIATGKIYVSDRFTFQGIRCLRIFANELIICDTKNYMASWLKLFRCHPFPVVAHFDRVVAVSFAFPEAVLRPIVPRGLEIDTCAGFGFITAAMVWTKSLRPKGTPAIFGQDFFLSGYRIFTRLRDNSGRSLRGLYILRSETDKHRMVWAGNLLTGYRYRYVKVHIEKSGVEMKVKTSLINTSPTLNMTFEPSAKTDPLPDESPFKDWKEARRFAGPMPFTFSAEGDGSFVVIEGSRQDWVPQPVRVKSWQVSLFDEAPFREGKPILANAFSVENVSYQWKRGRVVRPGGCA